MIGTISILALALLAGTAAAAGVPATVSDALLGPALDRAFPDGRISYLLLDPATGVLLHARWESPELPIPLGSLVKPFVALAYAEAHSLHYPEASCGGVNEGCWYPPGHGRLTLPLAVAHSCNRYFLELATGVDPGKLAAVVGRLGITAAPAGADARTLIGLGDRWKVAPLAMAGAYAELARRAEEPGVGPLIGGLSLAAQSGTAAGVGRALSGLPALAKTGTAPCVHRPTSDGDGYVIALYPVVKPRYLLLLQMHALPGRATAEMAGQMLRVLVEQP